MHMLTHIYICIYLYTLIHTYIHIHSNNVKVDQITYSYQEQEDATLVWVQAVGNPSTLTAKKNKEENNENEVTYISHTLRVYCTPDFHLFTKLFLSTLWCHLEAGLQHRDAKAWREQRQMIAGTRTSERGALNPSSRAYNGCNSVKGGKTTKFCSMRNE